MKKPGSCWRMPAAGKTVPLGDGFHAAVAALEDLTVATVDVDHFKALGVRAVNPLK